MPNKSVDLEFNLVGVKYSDATNLPTGLITDNGFTLIFVDKKGKPLPLNEDAIKRWMEIEKEAEG